MLAPSLPLNVTERSYTLHSFPMLDSPLQEKFERITRLAKNLFDVPMAYLSFLDDQSQRFKSLIENEIVELPHDLSFCGLTLLEEEVFNVPETLKDERFRTNPYVIAYPHIQFYAGHPIIFNHHKIGTFSIIDHKPRYFSPDQLLWLKDMAALIETEIQNYTTTTDKGKLASDLDQARMALMVDPLTSLWNRQGMYNILKYRMDEYLLTGASFGIAILDIDHFKNINDTFGHESGDQAMRTIADSLIAGCRETDAIGRWGGEEFLLLINEPSTQNVIEIAQRIRVNLESQPINLPSIASLKVTATIGLTTILPGSQPTLKELINKADQALYQGKRGGRNQVVAL